MSDFTNNFWSTYITVITLVGIFGCVLLLWLTGKIKAKDGDKTSGHVWDGITEMNNPLPRWWVWLFVITIVFSLGYLVVYPGLGSYAGRFGWTSTNQLDKELAKATQELKPLYAKFAAMSTEDLAKDAEARGIGERLFLNNCAQCHGSDARGSRGFPNLTDNDWLYGGSPKKITETINNGRNGMMPPMAAIVGSDDDILNLANYVMSLSGTISNSGRAKLGQAKYAACGACHGAEGKGNQDIGAPNLTDNVWLHGAGEAAIIKRIQEGKTNQMPPWQDKFTPEQVHVLTAYVWGLSNNKHESDEHGNEKHDD